MQCNKTFKEETLRLLDEIDLKNAASQLGIAIRIAGIFHIIFL